MTYEFKDNIQQHIRRICRERPSEYSAFKDFLLLRKYIDSSRMRAWIYKPELLRQWYDEFRA